MAKTNTSFKKGHGGRPKGKPNKITSNLRDWISDFIDGNRQQIQDDWKGLEPKDRIVMFEKLLKYTLPTLQATSLNTDNEMVEQQVTIFKLPDNGRSMGTIEELSTDQLKQIESILQSTVE